MWDVLQKKTVGKQQIYFDEDGKVWIWLVWNEDQICAITTSEELAVTYKKTILQEADFFDRPRPHVLIESRDVNHLYGYDMRRKANLLITRKMLEEQRSKDPDVMREESA